MLQRLEIRNIVLIEELTLDFAPGLMVITGETGAGKSILLDSLGLALGMRAEAGLVRAGQTRATVTATFDLPADHPVHAALREHDLEGDGEALTLKRSLNADGRSRASINDLPVSIAILREIGSQLIEIQGQFDQHGLLDPAQHLVTLDEFARTDALRAATSKAWSGLQAAATALSNAEKAAARAESERAFLGEAVAALESLSPVAGEEAQLTERRSLLSNLAQLRDAAQGARELISGTDGAEDRLGAAARQLERLHDSAQALVKDSLEALDRAIDAANDAVAGLDNLEVDADPGELATVEDRLFALRDAARRHKTTVEELPALWQKYTDDLSLLEGGADQLTKLAEAVEAARECYAGAADSLTKKRRGAATRLDAAVMSELPSLKLEQARFLTEITALPEPQWRADGRDGVQFTLATNPGQSPSPLHKTASGGELSRLLLALKVTLATVNPLPSLVFDEVDSGIGGATADAVGERLKRLAGHVQVLVITHSPQVAARADRHFFIAKTAGETMATTDVVALSAGERQEELARMMSGAEITDAARAAAQQLIEAANG